MTRQQTPVSDIFIDWVELMDILGKWINSSEVNWIIRMMLITATTKKDLRRLHNEIVEPNLRLTRNHLTMIEKFWEKHFKQPQRLHGAPVTKAQALLLLSPGNSNISLQGYYIELIEARAGYIYRDWVKVIREGNREFKLLLTSPKRQGHGEYHYMIEIFKHECEMSCYINKSTVRVRIRFPGNSLTEELTHHIITELPIYDLGRFSASIQAGAHLDLIYDLEDKDFRSLLEQGLGRHNFLGRVVAQLEERGVPVTRSYLIE